MRSGGAEGGCEKRVEGVKMRTGCGVCGLRGMRVRVHVPIWSSSSSMGPSSYSLSSGVTEESRGSTSGLRMAISYS